MPVACVFIMQRNCTFVTDWLLNIFCIYLYPNSKVKGATIGKFSVNKQHGCVEPTLL